jgi:DNA polymerase elongation subunit (family B)
VAIALEGNDGRKFCFDVPVSPELSVNPDDERNLLKKAYAVCLSYWCLMGWNIKLFDMIYIKERTTRLGLNLDWDQFIRFDLMDKYEEFLKRDRKPGEITNKKLDSAALRMLGEGKEDFNIHKMMEVLRDNPEIVRKYVKKDAELVNRLYGVKGIGSLCEVDVSLSQHLYTFPTKMYPTYLFELYLDIKARGRKIKLPNKWEHYHEKANKKGIGGLVLEPVRGLHKNVMAMDFKSLYPNIMRTHNIGINNGIFSRKKADNIINTAGMSFRKDVKGLTAEVMDELIMTRYIYRDKLDDPNLTDAEEKWYGVVSDSYKTLLVSANGIFDNKYFKFRNQPMYNATTKTGQWYLNAARKILEKMGYKVLYGDTDSIFFEAPYGGDHKRNVASIPFLEDELNRRIKNAAVKKFNLDPNKYYIDFRAEKIYSKIFFSEKKNYVGRYIWKEYKWIDPMSEKAVDAKGIVMMKYNTIPIVKETMMEIFKILLSKIDDEKELKRQFIRYLQKLRADLYAHHRDELLMISQRVDKMTGYKSEPPHIKAAKKLDKLGLFEPGMNVEYIRDESGEIFLYGVEDFTVSRRTYDRSWRMQVGKWVDKILGREISSHSSLDFGYSKPAQSLI